MVFNISARISFASKLVGIGRDEKREDSRLSAKASIQSDFVVVAPFAAVAGIVDVNQVVAGREWHRVFDPRPVAAADEKYAFVYPGDRTAARLAGRQVFPAGRRDAEIGGEGAERVWAGGRGELRGGRVVLFTVVAAAAYE